MGSNVPRIFVRQGQRFGRGVVIDPEIRTGNRTSSRPTGRRGARLRCDCGTVYESYIDSLAIGKSQSCGCFQREQMSAELKITHGLHRHSLYMTWFNMLDHCENPASENYRKYGGQGLTVCQQWHDVTAFITWIEKNLGPRPDGMDLWLTSGNKQYRPGSVQWATTSQRAGGARKRRGTSSRYKGVSLLRRDGTWVAEITVNYRRRYLGRFPTEEAAASAYDDAAIAAWGRFARLNFPGDAA